MDRQARQVCWAKTSSNLEWRRKSTSSIESVESTTSSSSDLEWRRKSTSSIESIESTTSSSSASPVSRSSGSRSSSPASKIFNWRSNSDRPARQGPKFAVGDIVYVKPRHDGHSCLTCPLKCTLENGASGHPALIISLQEATADVSIITSFKGQSLEQRYMADGRGGGGKANSHAYQKHVDKYLALGSAAHVHEDWPVLKLQGGADMQQPSYLKYCEVKTAHLSDITVFGKDHEVKHRLTSQAMADVAEMRQRFVNEKLPPR